MQHDERLPRRRFLKVLGASSSALASVSVAGCASAVPAPITPAHAPEASQRPAEPLSAAIAAPAAVAEPALALNASEYAFVEAAVDTLIPEDDLTPAGAACGVAVFIDRQLAGAFGAGARMYRSGPFLRGKPEHGYQLAFTPLELFKQAIAEINAWTTAEHKRAFDALPEPLRIEALTHLEKGTSPVSTGQVFFELLLTLTMEGFFADPIYGGNRDKVAWKMLGYPGLPATYEHDIVTYHARRYEREPQSILDFT